MDTVQIYQINLRNQEGFLLRNPEDLIGVTLKKFCYIYSSQGRHLSFSSFENG